MGLLQEEFEEHAEKAKTLSENTTNENKLILYGPVNTSKYLSQIVRSY